jgi:hypothetical protein
MSGQEKRLLVTGCGRSGTKFIAALLQNLGMDVRHEQMGADGIATWCMAVESDDSPWGGGRRGVHFKTILHQVRHPLKVIPSLLTFTSPSWEFIEQYVPCPRKSRSCCAPRSIGITGISRPNESPSGDIASRRCRGSSKSSAREWA